MRVHLTPKSKNAKTGPIPVSTTERRSCPDACPFKGNGCYAESGPLLLHWRKVSEGERGMSWAKFCDKIEALPADQLWRHNQAGDLPHSAGDIDMLALGRLVTANRGKRGFTYTHHVMNATNVRAVKFANELGFTINLSANNLKHADELLAKKCGPVVTVVPSGVRENTVTPNGAKVVICPATVRDDVSCASCQLCQRANRDCVVAFPAHGTQQKKASEVAR